MSRLVIHGATSSSNLPAVFFGLSLVAGAVTAVLAERGHLPWLPFASRLGAQLICFMAFVLGWAVALFVSRRSMARAGRVEIDEQKLVFHRDGLWVAIQWTDCKGFKDGDADFIEVELREEVPLTRSYWPLTIPTPSEKDRVAVLAVLDAHGLKRLS